VKIDRLHLKAFGGFADFSLDFSGGSHGFHLVYGPNEAGKSTTLRAVTQLLYGMGTRTNDDFLHPMQSLRVGATLLTEDGSLAFYRRKGTKNTLLAEDNKTPLADGVLAPYLGNVDEETFKHLFGLSHDQLVEGGKALVEGRGDVGQALFSAAAGMGNLKGLLEELEGRAGALFKSGGKKPRINEALKAYRDAHSKTKAAQILPAEWSSKSEALEEACQKRDMLLAQINELIAEQSRLERVQRALPLVSQRLQVLKKLADIGDAVLLPDDFSERRTAATHSLSAAKEQYQIAEVNLQRLAAQLSALEVDEALLTQGQRIRELHDRHVENRKSLRDKQTDIEPELRREQAEAKRLLRELKCTIPLEAIETLRPAPGVTRCINDLTRVAQANEKDRCNAQAQGQKLTKKIEQCKAELLAMGERSDVSMLHDAIREARPTASLEAEYATRQNDAIQLAAAIDDAMERLGDWSGTREVLLRLPVPAASSIERFRLRLESEKTEAQRRLESIRNLENERDALDSELDALQRGQNVPTEAILAAQRECRENGWQLAREAWESGVVPRQVDSEAATELIQELGTSGTLADVVENLTRQADDTADRLRRESDRTARLVQLESNREALAGCQRDLDERGEKGDRQHADTLREWMALWAASGITPRSPEEMAEWRAQYIVILEDIQRATEEGAALAAHRSIAEAHRERLISAMTSTGYETVDDTAPLRDVLARAESYLAEHENKALAYQRRRDALEALEEEEADLAQTRMRVAALEEDWLGEWAMRMESIGAPPETSPAEAEAKLELLTSLFNTLDDSEKLVARIAQIDREYDDYIDTVAELADALEPLWEDHPHDALVPALYEHLERNREDKRAQLEKMAERERSEEARNEAEAALDRAEAELLALQAQAQVDSAAALEKAEIRSKQHREFSAELNALEERLLECSPGFSIGRFLETVDGEEADALVARLAALGPALEEAGEKRDALFGDIAVMDQALAAMDGSSTEAVAFAAEAQGHLAGIRDDAREYARLMVSAQVLKEAIERYRAANQDPLLARASEVFATLTLDSFQELRADYAGKGEDPVLCGVRSDGGAFVHVAGMSEGTADQLYLALRLASVERHLENNPPVPFVLDDILVNFDDQRAAAALKVLGKLSERTQVIYFTHHEHLAALAKKHVNKKQLCAHRLE
jgi:uncharacterized protein YhaN